MKHTDARNGIPDSDNIILNFTAHRPLLPPIQLRRDRTEYLLVDLRDDFLPANRW